MNDHWKNLTHQSLLITGISVSYLEETECTGVPTTLRRIFFTFNETDTTKHNYIEG